LNFLFYFKVNLRNEAHERSNISMRSGDIQAGKTARYLVRFYFIYEYEDLKWKYF
jgi:hypothetical protein